MAVKESEKTYIECRIFLLGEKNVGKKSFIGRLLNLPSTTIIRNYEAEKDFNKKMEELTKKIEEEEAFMNQSKEDRYKSIKNRNESNTLNNSTTQIKKSSQISESKDSNLKINEKEKQKIQMIRKINSGYKVNFLPSKIAKSKVYHRPPIPEFPSKLFNIFKTKMIFKPYFISPAEDILFDSNSKDDEDSDYEFEKEHKLTMKGVKRDINQIMNIKNTMIELDKISGYTIYIYYIFLFLYDTTEYSSFETVIKYFDRLEAKYNITKDDSLIPCIIGNKSDRNSLFNEEQTKTLNEFITKYNIKHYDISTKPFFNFSKFYSQFIIDNLGPKHEFFEENNFKDELRKIIENKSTFSKAERTAVTTNDKYPGPEYDLNIYSFNSMKELKEALINKKTRFNKKIYVNKQGPIISNSKSAKEIANTDNKEKRDVMYIESGGTLNKPIFGFSFGISKGRLNLVKARRDLNQVRAKNLIESIEGDSSINLRSSTINYKSENYLEEASARKSLIQSNRIKERQKKLKKIEKIHHDNLEKIAAEKEAQRNLIIPTLRRSSSAPDFMNITNENKQKYYEVVFGKNKEYLDKFNKRRILIEQEKIREEKIREEKRIIKLIQEEKNKKDEAEKKRIEDERKEKFRIRMSSTRSLGEYRKTELGGNYPTIKDEFEILVQKNMQKSQIKREFKPRFEEIKKEKINNVYKDQEIWKQWEENKQIISNKGRLRKFLEGRKRKEMVQKENVKKLEKQNEEIQKIRREIYLEKGYGDPLKLKEINYSQVEEASPKYSLKGRNIQRQKRDNEDTNNFLLGQDKEIINYIKNVQMNRPLPNINIVKPNLPRVIFSKAERFIAHKNAYEGKVELFKDGIFAPKTQEDFFSQGTFSKDDRRSLAKKEKSPSPCDYVIKSSFEVIAEKGKKISEIREQNKEKEKNKRKFINNEIKKIIEKEKEMQITSNTKNQN